MGHARNTSEAIIGTTGGVIRAYACKRKPEEDRWQIDRILNMAGTPQRPQPSRPGLNVPIRVEIPEVKPDAEIEVEKVTQKEVLPRRRVITMKELEKYGFTPGCPGCETKRRGGIAKSGHDENCRKRIEERMMGDELGRAQLDEPRRRLFDVATRQGEKKEELKRKVQITSLR